ncbi:MAG: VOC family protein [Alphaproteobacteria bacterium]|nr:VOC family protein [Alphaproteobacteria bacterium]
MQHGTFAWNELMTGDVERAKAFYSASLGWTFERFPGGDMVYWVAKAGDKPVGGVMAMEGAAPPGTPPHWFAYIEVDNVDKRVAKVAAAGGKVLRPCFDVPGVGRIAIVQDATGAAIGWITSAARS